jgi:hypothetical protein
MSFNVLATLLIFAFAIVVVRVLEFLSWFAVVFITFVLLKMAVILALFLIISVWRQIVK